MIIDVHTHLNNYDETQIVPVEKCLEQLHESMAYKKVDHAMVLTSYTVNEHLPSTAAVVKVTDGLKNLHVVAGISVENYRERDLREIAIFSRTAGWRAEAVSRLRIVLSV